MFDGLISSFEKTFIRDDRYLLFLKGLGNTLLVAIFATLLGVLIGSIVAIIKVYNKQTGSLKILSAIAEIYTTVIRGTPVVVQLLIMYNVIFVYSDNAVLVGILGFGINSGAYVAEIIRGGINAVDIGQTEAGRSLGLSRSVTMRSIVLPQAIKNVLPAIGNECIALLKETSVAGYVAVVDVTKAATNIRNKTYDAVNPIILLALIYLVMVVELTRLLAIMERRLRKSDGK